MKWVGPGLGLSSQAGPGLGLGLESGSGLGLGSVEQAQLGCAIQEADLDGTVMIILVVTMTTPPYIQEADLDGTDDDIGWFESIVLGGLSRALYQLQPLSLTVLT